MLDWKTRVTHLLTQWHAPRISQRGTKLLEHLVDQPPPQDGDGVVAVGIVQWVVVQKCLLLDVDHDKGPVHSALIDEHEHDVGCVRLEAHIRAPPPHTIEVIGPRPRRQTLKEKRAEHHGSWRQRLLSCRTSVGAETPTPEASPVDHGRKEVHELFVQPPVPAEAPQFGDRPVDPCLFARPYGGGEKAALRQLPH